MRQLPLKTWGALVALLVVLGCGGGGGVTSSNSTPLPGPDAMTPAQVAAADRIAPMALADPSTVRLADGRTLAEVITRFGSGPLGAVRRPDEPLTPLDRKARLIATMIQEGNRLATKSNFPMPANGATQPAQNGLAYVYGGKSIAGRSTPQGACSQTKLKGVDCSGFISLLARTAGINLVTGTAATQSLPSSWNTKFEPEWRLEMKSIPAPAAASYETGDIIGWANHIAIVDAPGSVLQSNGYATGSPNPHATVTDACRANYNAPGEENARRGPRRFTIAQAIQIWGAPLRVLRITPKEFFTVQLRWGAEPDVDLHVFEPNGTQVYYSNKVGQSGFLDVDDVTQFGPEHYRIQEGQEPEEGDYRVGVVYFRGQGPEVATVNITTGSDTRTFTTPLTTATGGISPIPVATIRVTKVDGTYRFQILQGASRPMKVDRPAPPKDGQ